MHVINHMDINYLHLCQFLITAQNSRSSSWNYSTLKNPQTNAFVEQIRQLISSCIRTMELHTKAFDDTIINAVLQNVAYGLRATNHSFLSASPCQLVFGRDMVINAI
jgi:hypothetical protein